LVSNNTHSAIDLSKASSILDFANSDSPNKMTRNANKSRMAGDCEPTRRFNVGEKSSVAFLKTRPMLRCAHVNIRSVPDTVARLTDFRHSARTDGIVSILPGTSPPKIHAATATSFHSCLCINSSLSTLAPIADSGEFKVCCTQFDILCIECCCHKLQFGFKRPARSIRRCSHARDHSKRQVFLDVCSCLFGNSFACSVCRVCSCEGYFCLSPRVSCVLFATHCDKTLER